MSHGGVLGQTPVEDHLCVGAPHGEEVADDVLAEFVDHVAEGDELAGAGGEFGLHAVLEERDHLVEDVVERLAAMAKGEGGSDEAGDLAVVVGAQEGDEAVVAAGVFVLVVGDVGSDVGVAAVALDEDAVACVAELGGLEPDRAVGLIDRTARAQFVDYRADRTAGVEGALAEPVVEDDAHFLHVGVDGFEDFADGEVGIELCGMLAACDFRGELFDHEVRNVDHIVAAIIFLRGSRPRARVAARRGSGGCCRACSSGCRRR